MPTIDRDGFSALAPKDGCKPSSSSRRPPCGCWLTLESIGMPAFSVDVNGCVTEWNAALTAVTDTKSDKVLYSPFILDEPGDQQRWTTALRRCLHGKNSKCDIFLKRQGEATGAERFGIRLSPQKVDGRVVRAICFVDVTEDESPTADANEPQSADPTSAASLDSVLRQSNVSVCVVDLNLQVVFWNDRLIQVSGYSAAEAMECSVFDIFRDHDKEPSSSASAGPTTLKAILQQAVNLGATVENLHIRIRNKAGGLLDLLCNIAPRKSGNVITGAILVALQTTRPPRRNGSSREAQECCLSQWFGQLPSPVIGVDNAGLINEWNDKAAGAFGFTFDEAIGQSMEGMIAPTSREILCGVLEDARKGRGTSSVELELRTKYYDTRYLTINAAARRDGEQRIVGAICVGLDTTEASKHDRTMVAMARELRQLIDLANAPIFGIDEDRDVNEWNDKTAEITGYTKEEAFDCNLIDNFIVPHMRASVQDVLDSALQGRGTSNFELEFRTKSGEIRHLLVNATTRRDASNAVVGVVCVAQDVTESVQRDRAVAGMALELRQLIDCANAPIFGIDIDGNINEWNRCTQKITGYSKEETFDEPLVERFIAPDMQETVREILQKALSGVETSNYELEFISKSGEPRFMIVNATTRRDSDHNVVGVVGVGQDITEDRKHAAELQKLHVLQATQEAKVEVERSMTAYFAHELRNPLSAIDSALNAMPDCLPQAVAVLVSGMRLCSSFMSKIMNNLLDVRKMEEGKMVLNAAPICLATLLDGVYSMLAPSVKAGVMFKKTVEVGKNNWVLGDEHRILQVFTNVVTNAIKYTSAGSIILDLRWQGDCVNFICIDTGPGIPKNEQTKLFQRYVQRGGAPGTGLGLAIAKHLVDLFGGAIKFDSDPSVKAGTACIVSLPLPSCDPPEFTEDQEVAMIEEPLRFLIVDDVKMNRMMLSRRIEKGIAPSCKIMESCTGEEALEICKSNTFDVIIVDQFMEKAGGIMVGTDVVYAMRRMRMNAIIVGCSGNDLEQEFRDAGADLVWQKPMPSNVQIIAHLRLAMASKLET